MTVERGALSLRGVMKTFPAYHAETVKGALTRIVRGQRVFDRRPIFDGLDLEVSPGERLGIVGRNGAGKSTLFRLIAGIVEPDAGTIEVGGRVSPLIEITAGLVLDMTGGENLRLNASILGLTHRQIAERYRDIVSFAELDEFIDTPVRYYSSGMLARLGFSVAVHVDADIVLIDEVLAVGDAAFQKRCLERIDELSRRGVTVILVSHDLAAVETHMQRVVWLDAGRVKKSGSAQAIVFEYAASIGARNEIAAQRQKPSP